MSLLAKSPHPASGMVESAAYVYNCAGSDVHATTCAMRPGGGGSGCRVEARRGRSRCIIAGGAELSLMGAGIGGLNSVLLCKASGTCNVDCE